MSGEVVRLLAVNDQLAAGNYRLRAELADAQESAMAAWDAASDRPARPARKVADGAVDLAGQPFSGVRRLISGGDQ